MYEGATAKSISLLHRVKVALEWTIKYYAVFILALLLSALVIFILLLIVDKLKIINTIRTKLNE